MAAIENIVVPEQIVPPVTENSESVKLEPTSIEKPSPAEESDVALEHTEPKNADIAEPSYEVPVTEATIPGSPVDGQEETSEPKVQEPVPEKSHLVLETESHPLEQACTPSTSSISKLMITPAIRPRYFYIDAPFRTEPPCFTILGPIVFR